MAMEYQAIINLITSLGLPTAIAIILWKRMEKQDSEHKINLISKDDQNRKYTEALMEIRDERITTLEECSKEDKKIFQNTVSSFNNAIAEFKCVNNNMASIECKLNTIEQDITVIKVKMDK